MQRLGQDQPTLLDLQLMSNTAGLVAPSLELLWERSGRQARMALQEPIEAQQITHPYVVPIAKALHAHDVLLHCRAENTAPMA